MSKNFSTIVVGDFEYEVDDGDLPNVLCMVAYVLDENLQHVRTIRLWRGEFGCDPPFDIGPDTLFVAYSAWAEMTCFMVWAGNSRHTSSISTPPIWRPAISCCRYNPGRRCASGSASACPTPAALMGSRVGSASTRTAIAEDIGEGRWREYGQEAVLDYCEEDVRMSAQLLRAQLRGYGRVVAAGRRRCACCTGPTTARRRSR